MQIPINNFVDIHTHILPGLDDGPKSNDDSLLLARLFVQSGTHRLIATPHYLPGTVWSASRSRILEALSTLQNALEEEGVDLKIEPGMEIGYHGKLEKNLLDGKLLPLGKSEIYLIEPSFQGEQGNLLSTLESLLKKGKKLILAHPERAAHFQQRPELLEKVVDAGLQIQVNSGSMLGHFGSGSRNTADYFRKRGWIHYVASDAHGQSKRGPVSPADWATLVGLEGAEMLFAQCSRNIVRFFV